MPLFGKKGDGNQPSSVFVVGAVDQSPRRVSRPPR
jgi:hypothetical protein